MTKRFSPKASSYTVRLATVQAEMVKIRKQLAILDAEERALKAFLMPFYDEGQTEVDAGTDQLMVNFSTSTRDYLDQEKARVMLARLGKKVPEFSSSVITFKVKVVKG